MIAPHSIQSTGKTGKASIPLSRAFYGLVWPAALLRNPLCGAGIVSQTDMRLARPRSGRATLRASYEFRQSLPLPWPDASHHSSHLFIGAGYPRRGALCSSFWGCSPLCSARRPRRAIRPMRPICPISFTVAGPISCATGSAQKAALLQHAKTPSNNR